MDKVLKRVSNHRKQNNNSSVKPTSDTNSAVTSSSINKRYSVDDNFYTYGTGDELHENCNGGNYYTISNRSKYRSSTVHRSRPLKTKNSNKLTFREDPAFKKLFKVFNSGENSRGPKEWLASSANNVLDFAPRILSRRFGKKEGNELYRSNSFKFEKFERMDSDTLSSSKKSPVSRQISLCADYSLPVDFVNKRPVSFDSGSVWSAPSPNEDRIEVVNLYCDPKDSAKSQKATTSPDDLICQPVVADTDLPIEEIEQKLALYSVVQKDRKQFIVQPSCSEDGEDEDDEPELYENLKHRKINGSSRVVHKGNTCSEVRNSPYYYGDLLRRSQSEETKSGGSRRRRLRRRRRRHDSSCYSKCQSLDSVGKQRDSLSRPTCTYARPSAAVNSFDIKEEKEAAAEEGESAAEEEEVVAAAAAAEVVEMGGKQRHMYETAFDSKVCRTNDVLDLDMVTNHLMERTSAQLPYDPTYYNIPAHSKCSLKGVQNEKNKLESTPKLKCSADCISQHMTDLDINGRTTLLRGGYGSTSTSTSIMPLPQSITCGLDDDNLDCFSDSHSGGRYHSDNFFEDVQNHFRPVDPAMAGDRVNRNDNDDVGKRNKNIKNTNSVRQHRHHKPKPTSFSYRSDDSCRVSDSTNESRSKSCQLNAKILEIKNRSSERGYRKFSSTESMATSSSSSGGGSLESIRSSTSEGNRSTTSTDSNRSSSLSSHSSDFAVEHAACRFSANYSLGNRLLNNQNKMHVLSPISDKSFQEAGSDGLELNHNGNCEKVTPEERRNGTPEKQQTRSDPSSAVNKVKKRTTLQNKIIAGVTTVSGDGEAQQCSDSGISIESRSDITKTNVNADLSDLPFDMPKLRRRRLQQMQLPHSSTQDTSSSATSIDLKDLPFDMPKLRRRLRSSSTQDTAQLPFDSHNPFGSHSFDEKPSEQEAVTRPYLDLSNNRRSLGLSLNLNEKIPTGLNIDSDLPLERQGWYHGAISRLEAENELRNREEGSYLVRNSESAKNDYSLSLKSAKGFMHMRIQKSEESSKYILGQFSSPFDSIPQMIKYYSSNQLPIRGAEHMCLLQPVIAQLL